MTGGAAASLLMWPYLARNSLRRASFAAREPGGGGQSTSCSRETTSSAAREGSRSSAERVVHQVKVEVVP